MTIKPIFLFSLPRSGSTLLQSILATHDEIISTPEPWVMLPIMYSLRQKGIYAEYSHTMTNNAIEDFCNSLPAGKRDYYQAIEQFGLTLYGKQAGGNTYFLDKTPRYHVVAEDIMNSFATGKFIFLFRNPLSTLSSILETWHNFHFFRFDLFQGLEALIQAAQVGESRGIRIKFEDLTTNPQTQIGMICNYLKIKYDISLIKDLTANRIPEGKYGNPNRTQKQNTQEYSVISRDPLIKWKRGLSKSFIRKRYAISYLNWIGPERLNWLGFDFFEMRDELSNLPVNNSTLISDLYRFVRGGISATFETKFMADKIKALSDRRFVYPHQ